MKKKIYLFLTIFAVFALNSLMTSCGGGDDDGPTGDSLVEKLQGTWTAQKVKMKAMGQTMEMSLDELKDLVGDEYYTDEVLRFDGEKVNGQSYSVKGNKILLPWYDEWEEVSFSGSKMTLRIVMEMEGIKAEIWITYAKTSPRSYEPVYAPASVTLRDAMMNIAK